MTAEERAFNYASTQKPTKLQVGEIAKHYNNGYQQASQDFLEKAMDYFKEKPIHHFWVENFRNYMKNESEE